MNMFGIFNNKTQGLGGHQEIKKWDEPEGPVNNIEEKFWDESFAAFEVAVQIPAKQLYSLLTVLKDSAINLACSVSRMLFNRFRRFRKNRESSRKGWGFTRFFFKTNGKCSYLILLLCFQSSK